MFNQHNISLLLLCFALIYYPDQSYSQAPNVVFDYIYPYSDGIPVHRFKERRERILNTHSPKSLVISLSADIRNRQNDVDYEYCQNSNFWYITGIPDPHSALLLSPGGIKKDGNVYHEIAFLQMRKKDKEVWSGTSMGPQEAMSVLGLEKAIAYSEFKDVLLSSLQGIDTVYFTGLPTNQIKVPLADKPYFIETELRKTLQDSFPNLYVKVQLPLLISMREIKDNDEIRLMQKAIDISISGHKASMKSAKPGMMEYELEAAMEYSFKQLGAEDIGYSSIMGSSYNACILHYTRNKKQTENGDLVLADCGAEYQHYTADITRTYPINGKFSEEQKILYDIVLEAQDSAMQHCIAGEAFKAPHNAAQAILMKRLTELGIIQSAEQLKWYFMHGTSHYLGLDVHDAGTGGVLKKNSVITVEPGLYIPKGSPCDKKWWNIGIRIEDDILITDNGPINMSAALARTTKDIEQLMNNADK